jgi:hypothetical protein
MRAWEKTRWRTPTFLAERERVLEGIRLAGLLSGRRIPSKQGDASVLCMSETDLDAAKKTLRIERAWEQTKKFDLRLKPPKTKRGLRTIDLDQAAVDLLLKEKERHQRVMAGVPDGSMSTSRSSSCRWAP